MHTHTKHAHTHRNIYSVIISCIKKCKTLKRALLYYRPISNFTYIYRPRIYI